VSQKKGKMSKKYVKKDDDYSFFFLWRLKKEYWSSGCFQSKKEYIKNKKKYWIPSKIYSSRFGVISRANFWIWGKM